MTPAGHDRLQLAMIASQLGAIHMQNASYDVSTDWDPTCCLNQCDLCMVLDVLSGLLFESFE